MSAATSSQVGHACIKYHQQCPVLTAERCWSMARSRNSFVGEIPKSIGGCTALQGLDLSNNKLEGRSWDICSDVPFRQPRTLFLARTRFVTGEIPSSLGKLEKLKGLYLDNNALSGKTNVFGTSPMVSRVALRLVFFNNHNQTTRNNSHSHSGHSDHHSQRTSTSSQNTSFASHSPSDHHSQRPPLTPIATTRHFRPPLETTTTSAHNSSSRTTTLDKVCLSPILNEHTHTPTGTKSEREAVLKRLVPNCGDACA
jgi:hypothetical protein